MHKIFFFFADDDALEKPHALKDCWEHRGDTEGQLSYPILAHFTSRSDFVCVCYTCMHKTVTVFLQKSLSRVQYWIRRLNFKEPAFYFPVDCNRWKTRCCLSFFITILYERWIHRLMKAVRMYILSDVFVICVHLIRVVLCQIFVSFTFALI